MRNAIDNLMIFAAGFGTRMGALTADCPKPLLPVAGRPLIDRTLDLARSAGIDRPVVNTHYLADRMAAHLDGQDVAISHEAPEILETGGGLRHALPLFSDGPIMTLNSDVIWAGPNPLSLLSMAWDPLRMDALLLCIEPENAIGRLGGGDFDADEEGRLTRGAQIIFGGAQILKPDGLRDIPEAAFSLNMLWDRMIAGGRLFGLRYPGRWCDVGRPKGITLAEALLADDDV